MLMLGVFAGCSSVNFMGAEKWTSSGLYVSRWFLNPEYKDFETPKGTAFYGAAAEKVKNKYIIKYYMKKPNGDDTEEIPAQDMWKVKTNDKNHFEQDDDNFFFYVKNEEEKLVKHRHEGRKHYSAFSGDSEGLVPVKECYENGWCKVYPNRYGIDLYVKKSILYQGKTILNEKDKQAIESQRKAALRNKIKAMPAISPWITPPHELCVDKGGQVNSRGVCQAGAGEGYRICRELGARLPTIEELKEVVTQCGGEVGNWDNENNTSFTSCYREKGFSYETEGYVSSTVHINKYGITKGKKMMRIGVGYISGSYGSVSILCFEN